MGSLITSKLQSWLPRAAAPAQVPCQETCTLFLLGMTDWAICLLKPIKKMDRNEVVDDISVSPSQPFNMPGCIYGKGHRKTWAASPDVSSTSTVLLQLVNSDVMGIIAIKALGGTRYVVAFIEDLSRWTTTYVMRTNSECFDRLKSSKSMAETHYGRTLKCLRSDNGGEYMSGEFKQFLVIHGLQHQPTVPDTSHQNRVAERMNMPLMYLVGSMLHHGGVAQHFCAEALVSAECVRNRFTSPGLPPVTTPKNCWISGNNPYNTFALSDQNGGTYSHDETSPN